MWRSEEGDLRNSQSLARPCADIRVAGTEMLAKQLRSKHLIDHSLLVAIGFDDLVDYLPLLSRFN